MERKLFFFDVDGTLIDDTTKIVPGSAMEAIRTLKRDGHLVFLNSGRTLCFLEFQMEQFGISCAVCGCGTQVIVDGNTIFEKRIDHRRGIEIITASTMVENHASARVLEKNGFIQVNHAVDEDWGFPEPTPADKWIR